MMFTHFSRLKLAAVLMLTGLSLSACQTAPQYGQGKLQLSQNTLNALTTQYLKFTNPLAFATSTDGKYYSYRYCEAARCRDTTGVIHKAVTSCQSRSSKPCFILARHKDIVWKKPDGTPYTLTELQGNQSTFVSNSSNLILCQNALATDSAIWSAAPDKTSYVREAITRNMDPAFCAKLLGRSG